MLATAKSKLILNSSRFQDSLTAEDFQWSPGLAMVNKNNYTLTYSGHGSISSHVEYGTSPSRHQTSENTADYFYTLLGSLKSQFCPRLVKMSFPPGDSDKTGPRCRFVML